MLRIRIVTPLIVAALLLLGGCVPPQETAQPGSEQLNFQIVSDATPGDTDAYASYNFDLYLEQGQELALAFSAEGAGVMFSLFTPSEETWGYNPHPASTTTTEDGAMGYLKKGRIVAVEEGRFRFTVPESGDYLATVQSAAPKAEIAVQIDYQIQ